MYVCHDCCSLFDEPLVKKDWEVHDELSGSPKEYFYIPICPFCGSEEIDSYIEEEDDGEV